MNTDKFYLGRLCSRQHNFNNTGQSLLYKCDRSCVECKKEKDKERDLKRKEENQSIHYLGNVCEFNHLHESTNQSLRLVSSGRCVICQQIKDKKYYESNRTKILEDKKEYHFKNKEQKNKKSSEYNRKNREILNEKSKIHYQNNKEKRNKKDWEGKKKRLLVDPLYKLNCRMSNAIGKALKVKDTSKGGGSYLDFVDWKPIDLKLHLESMFTEGMSWDNYGEWHVDHIKPKSKFDYTSTTDESFKVCWSLDNLQPLWKTTRIINNIEYLGNLNKTNKYDKD
jgi:hypothetical protein